MKRNWRKKDSKRVIILIFAIVAYIMVAGLLVELVTTGDHQNEENLPVKTEFDNDDVIRETQKCESAGLKAVVHSDVWSHKPKFVTCEPK